MKVCLICAREFEDTSWICPSCHWAPTLIEGFPAFSPELALQNEGLAENAHHMLNQMQGKSFWFRGRNVLIKDMIKRFFPQARNVLEIGCGTGYVLNAIREILPTAKLTATEIYSYGLHYAAQRVTQPSEFLQIDARELPFKNEFDLIGAFDVLEHIEEDHIVVRNINTALKPGGGLILTVPQHPRLWSKADDAACHKRRYTHIQLLSLLKNEKFEILLDTSFMFFLLPLMYLQRLVKTKSNTYELKEELSLPTIIDKFCSVILQLERKMIRSKIVFPIGGSRLVVARRAV